MNKIATFVIFILIVFCKDVYSQYETIFLPDQVPTNMEVTNCDFAFATADTGYMTYNAFLDNTSTLVYLQTVDSGRNWQIIDTVHENFTVHQMCFNDGRGAIVGNVENSAAIELFNNSLSAKSFHTFPELSTIYSFSIINYDNIVFHGLNSDSQTCLGNIEISNNVPQITDINIVPECNNYQIFFIDVDRGWYQSGSNLVYTEDLGLSESIHINDVNSFDFYDSMHGAIQITNESGLKFTEDGGLNWIGSQSERADFDIDGFKMTSENTAHSFYHWNGTSGTIYYFLHISGSPNPLPIYSIGSGSPNASKGFIYESQAYWVDTRYNFTFLLNNDYYTKVPSINKIENISIFPIPARNQLQIKLSDSLNNNVKISITNEIGQTVYSSDFCFQEIISLDINDLDAGIYTLRLISENNLISRKFIKL